MLRTPKINTGQLSALDKKKIEDLAKPVISETDILNAVNEARTPINLKYFYNIDAANWYQTFPFAFEINSSAGIATCRFFLPIPPQNYTIQDMPTSEAHATIGGVVEEVNAPVFSMITLVGTTGLSINNPTIGEGISPNINFNINQRKNLDSLGGRDNIARRIISDTLNETFALIPGQEPALPYQDSGSAVNTPISDQNSIIKSLGIKADTGASGQTDGNSWWNKVGNYINPFTPDKIPTNEFTNGWAWTQALRQFFLIYQRERNNNTDLQLYFRDYKSRAAYRCVPRSVQFQQNANSPYLINYTIILKCWKLEDVTETGKAVGSINRFEGDLKDVSTTNITGVVSKVGKLCNTLNRFPSVAGSFVRNSTGSFL